MSTLPPLCGHEEIQLRFQETAAAGRLPQSLLLHGPDGVGKQRLGVWIAALVLCTSEGSERPCGLCPACGMVASLRHPDFHWFFPLPAPKGSPTPKKRRELLEEARLDSLEARRKDPFGIIPTEASAAIYLSMVNEIRARATRRPAIGWSTVFLIGDAERMVPQASSQEAANAFLKLLEEPPPDTLIVLTSSRPGELLPTIRSRKPTWPMGGGYGARVADSLCIASRTASVKPSAGNVTGSALVTEKIYFTLARSPSGDSTSAGRCVENSPV